MDSVADLKKLQADLQDISAYVEVLFYFDNYFYLINPKSSYHGGAPVSNGAVKAVRFRTGAFALVVMLFACRRSMAQVYYFPISWCLPLVSGHTSRNLAQSG